MKDVRNGRNAPAMTIESAAVLCSRFEKVSKVERARKKTERFARRAARRRATGLSFFKSLDSSAAAATAAGETFDFSDVLAAMDDDTAREEELSFKRDLDNFRLQGISRALNLEPDAALVWGGKNGTLVRCDSQFQCGDGPSCRTADRLRNGESGGWCTGVPVPCLAERTLEGAFAPGIVTTVEVCGAAHSELRVQLKGWLRDTWRDVIPWQSVAALTTFEVPVAVGLVEGFRITTRHTTKATSLWLGCNVLRVYAKTRVAATVGVKSKTVGWGALLDVSTHGAKGQGIDAIVTKTVGAGRSMR